MQPVHPLVPAPAPAPAPVVGEGDAPPAEGVNKRPKWSWNDEKDAEYVDALSNKRPHMAPHRKIGEQWDEVDKIFRQRYPTTYPALTTLKARFVALVKLLTTNDNLTYLSGANQVLKPHFELLRIYVDEKKAFEEKSDAEKQKEFERTQRAQIAMDTAQHQLDALLQAQGQGEDDADTPIPTLDIDAGDQETARANKKKRKASDNSAADDYFSEMSEKSLEHDEEALRVKRAMHDEDLAFRREERARVLEAEAQRLAFEREKLLADQARAQEEFKLRQEALEVEKKKVALEEKKSDQMSQLLMQLLSSNQAMMAKFLDKKE